VIDHVSLGCSDLLRAAGLYQRLLGILDYGQTGQTSAQAAFGPKGEQHFFLYPQADGAAVAGAGTHVAFSASTVLQIDRFAAAAVEAGLEVLRPAGRRPDISPFYYGTIVRDFDGNMIEAVVQLGP
jgi:catechol 2,3-dioxygenase-like lactoylglutathione lyase family enzyme